MEDISKSEEVPVKKKKCHITWYKTWPMLFFLIIGIANAILMKLIFIYEAYGEPQYGLHKFQKPWWVTMITFFGMALMVFPYMVMVIFDRKNNPRQLKELTDLRFRDFCEFVIPALVDIFENIVSAVCVVFVSVSIDSMMKSGTLVGVSLISRWIFKVHYPWYKWISIIFVVIALTMVGAAGIINAGESTTISTSRVWVAVIIVLKFISQVGYAIRISYEEYFARVKGYHPVMICGLEGCWSTSISAFVFMPISHYLPGPEGNGIHEDSIDTLKMVGNSVPIFVISVIMILLGGIYNSVSATLISRTSAVVRTLMEAFRTFLIWMVQFMIFYTFRTNESLYPYRLAGEEWGMGSYVQLAGFIIMTISVLAYNKIPQYPCCDYSFDQYRDEPKNEDEIYEDPSQILHGKKELDISEMETNTAANDEITVDKDIDEQGEIDSDVSVRSMSLGSDESDSTTDPSKSQV